MIRLNSPDWPATKQRLDALIEQSRTRLEATIPERDADLLRGRIRALRDLIAEVEKVPEEPVREPVHSQAMGY
jgi:hypothetical protein